MITEVICVFIEVAVDACEGARCKEHIVVFVVEIIIIIIISLLQSCTFEAFEMLGNS